MAKLIIVEGITGSGKTILSINIALRLQALGQRYLLYWENQGDHPLRLTDPNNAPIEDVLEQSRGNWRGFVNWLAHSDGTCILDGRLFHIHTDMLFYRKTPAERITAHIHAIAAMIQPFNPRLIYLYQSDIRAALMRTRQNRNERYFANQLRILDSPYAKERNLHGFEGLVAVFSAYRPFIDALFKDLPLPKLSIDTLGGDWTHYTGQAWSFLGYPDIPINRDAHRSMVKRTDIRPTQLTFHNRRPTTVALKRLPYKSRKIEPVTEIGPGASYQLDGLLAERYRSYDSDDKPLQDTILDSGLTAIEIL